ncbi:hypothetical protein GW17_00049374 [Ensete ventricosum]|nr:hypothetical protein GW17_00049374 [Ensete ventricosum]
MQLGTRLECVGSFPGRRKRVYLKKIETRQKIIMGNRKAYKDHRPEMDPGSNLGIRPRFGDAVGAHQEFAKTSPKVSERSLGICWEIVRGDSP